MNLLVDLGNSRLKWAVDTGGEWTTGTLQWSQTADIDSMLDERWGVLPAPERVLACSVAGREREQGLGRWLQRRWRRTPEFVRASAQWGDLRNGYDEPSQLGADRWAALIGARGEVRGDTCVVDCGTAVTVDGLRADGCFVGGAIFAGLGLSRNALVTRTATLRPHPAAGGSVAARTTGDAIEAGTLYAAAGAVDRVLEEFGLLLGPSPTVLITGGDALALLPHLRHPARHLPDLVLQGLARVAGSRP